MSIISQALERKRPDDPAPTPVVAEPGDASPAPAAEPAAHSEAAPSRPGGSAPRQQSTFEVLQSLKPYQRPLSQPAPAPLPPEQGKRRPARFQSGVFLGGVVVVAMVAGFFFIDAKAPEPDTGQSPSRVEAQEAPPIMAAPAEPGPAPVSPLPEPGASRPVTAHGVEPTPMVLRVQLELNPVFAGGASPVAVQPQVIMAAPPAAIEPIEDEPPGYEEPPPPRAPARPIVARSAIEEYKLEGVSWKDSNPMAMINDKIVSVGEKVGEATVKEIQKDFVIIEVRGKRIELR